MEDGKVRLEQIKQDWVNSKVKDADIYWLIEKASQCVNSEFVTNLFTEGLGLRSAWEGLVSGEYYRIQPSSYDIGDDWAISFGGRLINEKDGSPWTMTAECFGGWRAENSIEDA